jgi:hypothetical protein
MTAELTWEHPTSDIPETGLTGKRAAAPDELETVARALGLVACAGLEVSYTIAPAGQGRYTLSGMLRAEVVQTCVVSLDPVTNTIEEGFEAEFWPEKDIVPPRGGVLNLDEAADPEPIVAGQIAIGRTVFECLAQSLDPYPRKPGATLDWRAPTSEDSAGGKPEGPFAVLANIKTRR